MHGKTCASCGKVGHFAKVCRGKRANATPVNEIGIDPHNMESEWTLAPSDEEEDSMDVDLFVGSITGEEE